jgi:cysteine desulfurase
MDKNLKNHGVSVDVKDWIYMDYQATTPIDPRVVEEINYSYLNFKGNANSRSHAFGWQAEEVVDYGRSVLSQAIGATEKDIIFTSGATESNNIAIKGAALYQKEAEGRDHVITLLTEHKCVIESCRWLEKNGFKVTYLPVKSDGLVDLDLLKNSITEKTGLISVMAVHNEIGVIQPLKEIGEICNEKGIIFHTDAAQAFCKIPLNVDELGIDLMSMTAHKIYGPVGVGALYIRRKPKKVRLRAIISGGGQEKGLRSGTLPTALIAGFRKAIEISQNEMEENNRHVKKLFDRLYDGLFNSITHIYLNGSKEKRYYGNCNVSFEYIEGESLLMALKNLAVSSGSACTSASLESSYVLKALGVVEELAHTSIRFGFGRFTTEKEIDYVIDVTKKAVEKLREMSPLWEMAQEGIDLNTIKWDHH